MLVIELESKRSPDSSTGEGPGRAAVGVDQRGRSRSGSTESVHDALTAYTMEGLWAA